MKRKSEVNRLYTRPVLTKALRVPNELSFEEPVNPLLKHPPETGPARPDTIEHKEKEPPGRRARRK